MQIRDFARQAFKKPTIITIWYLGTQLARLTPTLKL
jgi:hypothetical protein